MMHENIKRFQISGEFSEQSGIYKERSRFEELIVQQIRDAGYIPLLDHGPHFSTIYKKDTESYYFLITAYGIKTGKGQSWEQEGVSGNGKILLRTQQNKSEES